ncbi:hypothetical protein MARA_33650 [Mycolicibacterium arabiense]|uniref:Uncharacterized protein n=1 Tax=Mycolicibacterium arabiense TaxID=1286181 RepID=A0A7I7RZ75_9MYCO|nr:hypothetical protein [Mycolicibacterium arabiense]MCV7371202.1 hypothetical protein [Mycolicibacterium arabiense]BBY49897.1 hypothetical protein MARA_33650 [Mycolicibacterium arabiense]
MSEPAGSSNAQPKKRGTGFPQLSLRESVEAIVAIGQHGADHSHDAAAAYLGHQTANSGAFRTKLAALRDWGLIARGDSSRVTLSELAQQLVLESPSSQLLLAAFESCRVFGMLYADSAKETPLEEQRLRNVVVMRHGVSTDQADKFIESFTDSVVYAGLGRYDGTRLVLSPRDKAFKGAEQSEDEPVTTGSPSAPMSSESPSALEQVWEGQQIQRRLMAEAERGPEIPVALRQTWPIDGGEIEFVIRTPKAMPPAIYALMADMAEVAAKMEQLLKPAAKEAPAPLPVDGD